MEHLDCRLFFIGNLSQLEITVKTTTKVIYFEVFRFSEIKNEKQNIHLGLN